MSASPCTGSFAPQQLTVPSPYSSFWTVCANESRTLLVVHNTGDLALLVSPAPGSRLSPDTLFGPDGVRDTARYALYTLSPPIPLVGSPPIISSGSQPDPEVNGQVSQPNAGWAYLAPGSAVSVRPTDGNNGAADGSVQIDVYATAQYALALAVSDDLTGQLEPKELSIEDEALECGKEMNVTRQTLNDPPPPADTVADVVKLGANCYTAVKALTGHSDQSAADLADSLRKNLEGLTKDFALKVPPEVWEQGGRILDQLAHDH